MSAELNDSRPAIARSTHNTYIGRSSDSTYNSLRCATDARRRGSPWAILWRSLGFRTCVALIPSLLLLVWLGGGAAAHFASPSPAPRTMEGSFSPTRQAGYTLQIPSTGVAPQFPPAPSRVLQLAVHNPDPLPPAVR
ncbi:MAG: hypothetical protein HY332_22575 [Chloroflexi bacterium]|nr:hypothetical protein [Chloroflexota bacterium]